MSTASRNCRNRLQRLQERGKIAPRSSGSRREDPGILWSPRLEWQNNLSGKHQTPCDLRLCQSDPEAKAAASLNLRERFSERGERGGRASSLTTQTNTTLRICGLEARAGTSPPSSFLQQQRAPP